MSRIHRVTINCFCYPAVTNGPHTSRELWHAEVAGLPEWHADFGYPLGRSSVSGESAISDLIRRWAKTGTVIEPVRIIRRTRNRGRSK
jgi:hypothetical protein